MLPARIPLRESIMPASPAQTRFDTVYITSTQIMRDLGVSRAGLLNARNRGVLPEPISVNDGQLFIWERNTIATNLEAWKRIIQIRRGTCPAPIADEASTVA